MLNILAWERNNLNKILGAVIKPQRTGEVPVMPDTDQNGNLQIDNFTGNLGKDAMAESKTIRFYTERMDEMEKFHRDILSALDKVDW